ncbi:hypothetical protein ACOMHN_039165 [Nucella lapillus]
MTQMLTDVDNLKDTCKGVPEIAHNMAQVLTDVDNLKDTCGRVPDIAHNMTRVLTDVDNLKDTCKGVPEIAHNMTQVWGEVDQLSNTTSLVPSLAQTVSQVSGRVELLKETVDQVLAQSCCFPSEVTQRLVDLSRVIEALKKVTNSPPTTTPAPYVLPLGVTRNLTLALSLIHALNTSQTYAVANLTSWMQGSFNAQLVYSGYLGGGGTYDIKGAPPTRLCLTQHPINDQRHVDDTRFARLYGGSYEMLDSHYNKDPLCAVCRTPRPSNIMVPGTSVCPEHWTLEYYGYLMGSSGDHATGADFICVDMAEESRADNNNNNNNNGFLYSA